MVIMFGQPGIHSGNLKSLPRLPEWRAQLLTSVNPCKIPPIATGLQRNRPIILHNENFSKTESQIIHTYFSLQYLDWPCEDIPENGHVFIFYGLT